MTTNQLAGRREWIALVTLVVPPLLAAIDITVLYFALPSIAADLRPSSTQQLWITDIFGFVLAGSLLAMGNIGDLIGRRRTLMMGCVVFGLASLASAFARNPEMLIASRAVQGFGAASLMPSALALLRNIFHDDRQRRTAITIWSLAISAGAGFGPLISGVLLNYFWWGSIFLINVPIIAVLLVAIPLLVPTGRTPRHLAGKFDVPSAVLSLLAVLGVIWGIKEMALNGVSTLPVAAIVAGLILTVVFVIRQPRLRHPVIAPELLRTRGFLPVMLVSGIGFFLVIGFGVFTTQFLMEVMGMRPLTAALWSMASPVLAGSTVPFAMSMVEKVKPAYLMAAGFVLAAAGFAVLTQVDVHSSVFLVVGGIVGIGVGTALLYPLLNDLVIAVSPPEQTGAVSALTKTFQEFGGALGLAIFGVIGTAIYRQHLGTSIAGVPHQAVTAARQNIGEATAIANRMHGSSGHTLLATARDAFAHSVSLTALIGIVIGLAAAVMVAFRLNHIRIAEEGQVVIDQRVKAEPQMPAVIADSESVV
jgi:DHA2 family multidrug resistance protein-like MFS transporter